ncbi:hypothetical protein NEF87_000343 [Candidatus Lokiarchaeum ossiferum]|uniref:DNA-directed RNA polymerase M/15kDa subunit domain-containing protein n=1 Tax=Candidatus Lokiarchaeum ossiferum TaxID=2951803 RepID=A0ABY6HL67_9ARCH|nr:hypothetical protein NEF87_000343 [Candidatus Lokiarchaeum sp. B-35]
MASDLKKPSKASRINSALSSGKKFRFCESCGSILLPKPRTQSLFCKTCNVDFQLNSENELEPYKKKGKVPPVKKKSHIQKTKTIIVEESDRKKRNPSITDEDREALEDLFEAPEEE